MRRFGRIAGRWALRGLSTLIILGIVVTAGVFYAFWYYGKDLPKFENLADYEPPIVSRVYAGDGQLIGEFASEKRVFVPYDRIPKRIIHAFIASEDQRFFSHSGIDPIGMLRAAWTTATTRRTVGGSTITQQVAKNFLLTKDRTMERKIKEMILAWRIDKNLTKEQILELYMNQIFLGRRSFGVAAASQAYFGKDLRELTIAQAAFLAGLPQAPSRYDPTKAPKLALRRRNYVIGRMRIDGYITAAEAEAALKEPLKVLNQRPYIELNYFTEEVRRQMLEKYGEKKMASGGYVVRSTLNPRFQKLAQRSLQDGLVAYDRRHGYRGPLANLKQGRGANWADGWKKQLQAFLKKTEEDEASEVHKRLKGYLKKRWFLAVVLEVSDKEAMIGLIDGRRGQVPLQELRWARPQKELPGKWQDKIIKTATGPIPNRVTKVLNQGDVILVEAVKDDPKGKAYPPHTYTLRQVPEVSGAIVVMDPHTGRVLAMSGGFSFDLSQFNTVTQARRQPGSSIKPFVYLTALDAGFTPGSIVLDAPVVVKIDGFGKYKPRNAGGKFLGPIALQRALEMSRNLVTIRVAQKTGLDRVAEMTVKFGIYDKPHPEFAMALGAYETTPLQMATAYSMLANGCKRVTPTFVDRIQDRYGKTIVKVDTRDCPDCRQAKWNNQSMPTLKDNREEVADPRICYQIVNMLQGVVLRGTGRVVASLNRPLGGKTGTTNAVTDAWFVGFSPELVVAVWVGFDKAQSLGRREQGGRTAAPIFKQFMKDALDGRPKTRFHVPEGLVAKKIGDAYQYVIPGKKGVADDSGALKDGGGKLDGTGGTY